MKEKMKFNDKVQFMLYKFRIIFTVNLIVIPLFLIFFELVVRKIDPTVVTGSFGAITFSCTIIFFSFYFIWLLPSIFNFRVLFCRNLYIVDGYIFKMHSFKKFRRENTAVVPKARAISEDGSITTDWIDYPKRYFKRKNQKVKLIVREDKGINFYIPRQFNNK